ncbi:ABC transporter ATP-binding protein [Aeropyrum camini]|uniref:ABC transporter ATP-binding protein n=1 Tax=Aeropyrum camini SY1 = JCM 12091 TaxID=1198449 RepID=U3TDI7_9CREN|nr:ABC transporter ATP-binding protein [Aeropyrum camini]BAN90496.1 ABC transporter ATP-binding protein [Aeropyrum camini SY1 = JCM 12091]
MAGVRLEGIVKKFGKTVALKGIDLEIRDGEAVVLLGPSGCGKTTTLRIVAGLERPDEGRVYFDGRDVTRLPPKDRNVAMVFQSYALWPHMRVFDNIAFPLKIKRVPRGEVVRRVRWAAELLEIDHLLDRYPHQLSGGQQQRVAVARAIVTEPEVLLMDESLSNLDAILRIKMRSEIKKLQKRLGVTMIYVTHDQVEAMVIGDRVVVMNFGEIQQVGTPSEVYHRPANTFVATFIGSPQMNILRGRIAGGRLEVLGGVVEGVGLPDGEVLVGVRPEDVKLGRGDLTFEAHVDFVEDLGSDSVVHLKATTGDVVVAKLTEGEPPSPGSRVVAGVYREKIHIFDRERGRALAHGV